MKVLRNGIEQLSISRLGSLISFNFSFYSSLQTLADPTAVLLLSMFLLASSQEVTETASEVDDQEAVASEEEEDKVGKPVVSFAVPQLYNAGQLYPVLVSMREKSVISFILRANPQYQN